ncbi:MAG TPA: helix-turn-helix domain-containing protein [Glaciihabitans sp.]|jgi:AcrR family transcriptional regulator|nr:helix-turn-helix domain-containing protein [Glaciihabitans sp.]
MADSSRQLLSAPVPSERADAARNRALILDAAWRLVRTSGVDAVTMDAVAREAGVGKGTVFRRFTSRAQLMQSLLNASELDFQQQFLFGPPPLGPEADPITRLIAFGRARIDLLATQGDLLRAADGTSTSRYSAPARAASHLHITVLLRAAGVEGDLPVLSFNLLASLDSALVLHENRAQLISMERLAAGWEDLVRRVASATV